MIRITFLLFILSLSNICLAQKKFKPFTLIVIKPDTAIIDPAILPERFEVEYAFKTRYKEYIKKLEDLLSITYFPEGKETEIREAQDKAKPELATLKLQEEAAKNFKYYHLISAYSAEFYKFFFSEPQQGSPLIGEYAKQTNTTNKVIADSLKADYLVYFSNIRTTGADSLATLKMTTILFSSDENRVLLSKEVESNAINSGAMWNCEAVLQCLLINGVRKSSEIVIQEILKRELN